MEKEYRMKFHNLSSFTSRLLLCAAVATSLTDASGGTLTVKFARATEVEIDGVVQSFAANSTFTPTAIPCIYKMRPAGLSSDQRTFAIVSDGNYDAIKDTNYRIPCLGDGNWVRVALNPYPAADTNVTLTAYKVNKVYYVDEKNGSDTYDGTAATHEENTDHGPKATLQAAHDVAATGSDANGYPVVLVAPGFYSNEVHTASYTASGTTTTSNRRLVSTKNIAFVASEGPEKTFIVGAPDPATEGNGADAIGGVWMQTTTKPAYIQGFTIMGCYSPASQAGLAHYGSAFNGCGSHRVGAIDCIISNNYAVSKYPATYYGFYQRTKIMENETKQYVTSKGYFISCVFAGNRLTYGNNTGNGYALHDGGNESLFCTYDLRNALNPTGRKQLHNEASSNKSYLRACLVYGLTDKSTINATYWTDSQAVDSPDFVDADARDYRLGALSPAIDAISYESLAGKSRFVVASDILGGQRIYNVKVDIGAVEYDWRSAFAEGVGKNLTITDASPYVTTNATGGLLIPSGALAGMVAAGGKYSFVFEISTGTLEAFVGGVSKGVYSAAGEQVVSLSIPDATTEFRFVFTPDSETPGMAVLKQIASNKGLVIIFR